MSEITSIQIQDDFLNKLIESGIGPENNFGSRKFDTKKIMIFNVSDGFPRLIKDNIPFIEIENVIYTISLSGIDKFLAEEL
jgi:hypothetical protein